jgi:hypothetical protein
MDERARQVAGPAMQQTREFGLADSGLTQQ